MQLHWLDPERLTDRDVAGAVAVLESSRQVDSPHQLSLTAGDFVTEVRHGFDGDPAAIAVVRGLPDGRDVVPTDDLAGPRCRPRFRPCDGCSRSGAAAPGQHPPGDGAGDRASRDPAAGSRRAIVRYS